MGAVSVPPAASFFLCFWPQAAICYLFFNLVAWSDANSVKGWNNKQERKISYLCQRLVYIEGYPLCQFECEEWHHVRSISGEVAVTPFDFSLFSLANVLQSSQMFMFQRSSCFIL